MSYETLIEEIRTRLDSSHQAALDLSLQDIRRLVPKNPAENKQVPDGANAITRVGLATASSPTYVGKASDIHFIQSIRQCVHGPGAEEEVSAQNYSQTYVSESLSVLTHPLLFPSQTEADQYLDVYLSTIHIAYPFISKPILMDAFKRFQNGEVHEPEFRPWLAIFSKAPRSSVSSPRGAFFSCVSFLLASCRRVTCTSNFLIDSFSRFHIRHRIVLYVFSTWEACLRATSPAIL
jgi:hypothetical protein